MATKKLSGLATKTTLETGDSFVLSTPDGGRRITKSNFEINMRENLLDYKRTDSVGAEKGDWLRVLSFDYTNTGRVGILMITHNYAGQVPAPLVCVVGMRGATGAGFTVTPLANGNGNGAVSFSAARLVNTGSAYYLELKLNSKENTFIATFLGDGTVHSRVVEVSDATDSQVIKTIDLTATPMTPATLEVKEPLNSIDMESIGNQNVGQMGGGGIEFSLYPYRVTVRQKGGRHEHKEIERTSEKQSSGFNHFGTVAYLDESRGDSKADRHGCLGVIAECNSGCHNTGLRPGQYQDTGYLHHVSEYGEQSYGWSNLTIIRYNEVVLLFPDNYECGCNDVEKKHDKRMVCLEENPDGNSKLIGRKEVVA